MAELRKATLLFLVRDDEVLLAMKNVVLGQADGMAWAVSQMLAKPSNKLQFVNVAKKSR